MPNPLRSEADAFRWIVVIGAAAASVIAVALLSRPAVGAAWAAILIGFAAGFGWHALSGASARGGGLAPGAGERRRALVLADDGVGSATLLAQLETRGIGAGEVFLVVPLPDGESGEASELARQRLELALQAIEERGLRARGRLGDPDPGVALTEALREFGPDEIVIVGRR